MTNLDWVKVAESGTLADGRITTVNAGGAELCLVHVRGRWVALENECPHQGGSMGDGALECNDAGECVVQCPWHGWSFDAFTGRAPEGTGEPGLATYPVDVRDDGIYVGVESTV